MCAEHGIDSTGRYQGDSDLCEVKQDLPPLLISASEDEKIPARNFSAS